MNGENTSLILSNVYRSISHNIKSSESTDGVDWGLYSVILGEIIFLFYFAIYTGSPEIKRQAETALEWYAAKIPISRLDCSLCCGLSGILLGLHHLNNFGFADTDYNPIIPFYEKNVNKGLATISPLNYDLPYGWRHRRCRCCSRSGYVIDLHVNPQ